MDGLKEIPGKYPLKWEKLYSGRVKVISRLSGLIEKE